MKQKSVQKIRRILVLALVLSSASGRAETMKNFLLSCAYGTAAGAVVGLASVALSDKPSDNSMNIARGASLGLYAGIGFGIFEMNQSQSSSAVWIQPLMNNDGSRKVQGLEAQFLVSQF